MWRSIVLNPNPMFSQKRRYSLVFKSLFLAGFECATGYNRHGEWIDQVAATHHDLCAFDDYRLLREVGIHGARESIRWPLARTSLQTMPDCGGATW